MSVQPGRPSLSFRVNRPWGRIVAAATLAVPLTFGAAPCAGAALLRTADRVVAAAPEAAVQLAAGKNFQPPSSKPPRRGSSAELQGGSSAERYGGSSADRNGVAGRRDIRNRSVYARRERPRQNERRERDEQREQDEQNERENEQASGERQVLEFSFGDRRQR